MLPVHGNRPFRQLTRAAGFVMPSVAFRSVDHGSNDRDSLGEVSVHLELYGGAGVGPNAGGVRCANYADFQVKGIGSTMLAGVGFDKWHRHGALSLQDAVRETLMGDLFDVAAPCGAVRALGLADLGFHFSTEIGEEKLPGSAPRALLYRELSVRVAHFMRSSFMNVGGELAARDSARMRDGIPRFVDWLCRHLDAPNFEVAAQGLLLMFEPLMNQMAVLRTKRLVHGSLIPSNFCIDGRLIDFTTSTAVSTLQPVMVSLGGLTSQQQHHHVLLALPELLFYITKYDKRCAAPRERMEETAKSLVTQLTGMHHNYLMREHLGLVGFPIQQATQLDAALKNPLLAALIGAIESGSVQGHLYFGGDEHPMLPQAGRDDVFALVAEAIQATTGLLLPSAGAYRPQPQAFPPSVVREFVEAFRNAAQRLPASDLSIAEQGMAWLIRAMQRNADLTPLYRRQLDGAINDVCTQAGRDFGAFIDETLADWTGVFDSPTDGRVSLQGWLTVNDVSLTPRGLLKAGDELLSPLALSQMTPAHRVRPRHRWLFEVATLNQVN